MTLTPTEAAPVTLDIFADPVCPWSYIGKAYLDRALEAAVDHPFQIRWLPFMLNPQMPRDGMDRVAYLEDKFDGQMGAAKAYAPVLEHAQKAGVTLDLPRIERMPNTVDAHRLIHWAGIEECQTFVVHRVMKAYFEEGRDIGSHDVLADIADGAGMDAAMIHRLLSSDADVKDVYERDASARGMGVTSSPTFVVAGQHAVPGAQTPDLWASVINDIRAQQGTA